GADAESVVVSREAAELELLVEVRQRADEVDLRVDLLVETGAELEPGAVDAEVEALVLPLAEDEDLVEVVRAGDLEAVAVDIRGAVERKIEPAHFEIAVAVALALGGKRRTGRSGREHHAHDKCMLHMSSLPRIEYAGRMLGRARAAIASNASQLSPR